MLFNRPISRALTLCVIAGALLGATLSGTAVASDKVAAAEAQARYYASFGRETPRVDKVDAARAQGRYYASFRHSEPLAPPRSQPAQTPWFIPGIVLAIALLLAAAVTIEVRRLGARRRAARVPTSA